jgi:hypothetical protein
MEQSLKSVRYRFKVAGRAIAREFVMRFAIILLCTLSCSVAAYAADDTSMIPKDWLQKPISVAEAETAYPGITDDRVKSFPDAAKPFGFKNTEWEALKAEIQPGDELWTFSSPPASWQGLAGRAGIALVRNGAPIKILLGAMN